MEPIGGGWDAQLLLGPGCCLPDTTSSDITLVSTTLRPPGTLRRLLFGDSGKGTLKGATVYVARINNQGRTQMARPCDKCMSLLRSYGVSTVIYTIGEGMMERYDF